MKVERVYAVFDVVKDMAAHNRYAESFEDSDGMPDDFYEYMGEAAAENGWLIDLYSVHAVGEDGNTYSYRREFPYIRGNREKERALLLAERAEAAGEINLEYWELNHYLSMSLEGRMNEEYEREMREDRNG
jgi:hypothetical protein